jgi:hypothetical protein
VAGISVNGSTSAHILQLGFKTHNIYWNRGEDVNSGRTKMTVSTQILYLKEP